MSASAEFQSDDGHPPITITDTAKARILQVMEGKGLAGHSLRVGIHGRGPNGFQYGMTFEEPGADTDADIVVHAGELSILLDENTFRHAQGAVIDYSDSGSGGGFQIDNPNPVWEDPRAQTIQELLDEQINPAVARHGGYVQLMDVQGDTVYVLLGGGCQGCGMVSVTLKQGIEVLIKEALPEIDRVIDTTDHAGGTNPYYQPAKA